MEELVSNYTHQAQTPKIFNIPSVSACAETWTTGTDDDKERTDVFKMWLQKTAEYHGWKEEPFQPS